VGPAEGVDDGDPFVFIEFGAHPRIEHRDRQNVASVESDVPTVSESRPSRLPLVEQSMLTST